MSCLWDAVTADVTQRRNLLHIVAGIYFSLPWFFACCLRFCFLCLPLSRNGLLLAHHAGWEMQVRCFDNAITITKTCHFLFFCAPNHLPSVTSTFEQTKIVWTSKGRRLLARVALPCYFCPNLVRTAALSCPMSPFCELQTIFKRDSISHPWLLLPCMHSLTKDHLKLAPSVQNRLHSSLGSINASALGT